jgi:hypothetical protein
MRTGYAFVGIDSLRGSDPKEEQLYSERGGRNWSGQRSSLHLLLAKAGHFLLLPHRPCSINSKLFSRCKIGDLIGFCVRELLASAQLDKWSTLVNGQKSHSFRLSTGAKSGGEGGSSAAELLISAY